MAQRNSLYTKEIIKEGVLDHQEVRKYQKSTNMDIYNTLPFSFKFSKFCMMVEAELVTLSHVVLNVRREKFQDNCIINGGEKRDIKEVRFLHFTQTGKIMLCL